MTRTADALDPNTRTLLTEVQVPNRDGALRPGMYLQVKFIFRRHVSTVLIPAAALATRAEGPRLAVLDREQRVHYRNVQLGRDFGSETEVVAGLDAGEQVGRPSRRRPGRGDRDRAGGPADEMTALAAEQVRHRRCDTEDAPDFSARLIVGSPRYSRCDAELTS